MNKRGLITLVVIFVGLFVVFFGFSALMLSSTGSLSASGESIGVVEVTGPIMKSKKPVRDIRRFLKDDSIKGIVVRVDSPGGAVAPSQEIYDAVQKAKKEKPLAVSMGSTAASGGYYIACGADTVFANPGTVTGSIGVITQLFTVEKLVEKAQVDVHTIKTGPYKDSGSPFRDFTERDRAYFREMIDDVYDQFVEDVAECRDLEISRVRQLADGRVYTGRQAHEYKLVDKLGSFQDAVQFVADEAGLEEDPQIVYPPTQSNFLSDFVSTSVDGAINSVTKRITPVVEYRYAGP